MADKTFVKGLDTLTALVQSDGPRTLTSLAAELGFTKSNTHRLLGTLVEQGFVAQDGEKGLYRPTLRTWELGSRIVARLDVVGIAREQMPRLAEATGETVHLSALEGSEVIYLEKIEGTHAVRSYTKVGARAPAWCVATGKIMLAFGPEEAVAALDLHPYTRHSLTTGDALIAELRSAKQSGVAFNMGEWREDVVGAAAPIRSADGRITVAIGISGPAQRLTMKRLKHHSPLLKTVASDISRLLGYVPTRD